MKMFRHGFVSTLLVVCMMFSFGMCAYSSVHTVGMHLTHHTNDLVSHVGHALSLTLAVLPAILLSLAVVFFQSTPGLFFRAVTCYELIEVLSFDKFRPEQHELAFLIFSLRSPPKY